MRTVEYAGFAVVLLFVAGTIPVADAAEPSANPTTLWSFLGIPQGINKVLDNTMNRRGNFPRLERKPPLKSIADPSNLAPGEPAVMQKAAEIKIAEDKAPQKIKAVKYLAKVGCGGCYEGVDEALLSALEDCTEEVRYEAAVAFGKAAGDPCETCGGTGCCNAKTMTKLYEVAYAKDEDDCYKEKSSRVRAAARTALRACQRAVPMVPAPAPEPGPKPEPARGPKPEPVREPKPELPRELGLPNESPPAKPKPAGIPGQPTAIPDTDAASPLEDWRSREPASARPLSGKANGLINPITLTSLAQADDTRLAHRPATVQRVAPPAPGFPRQYVGQTEASYQQVAGFFNPGKPDSGRTRQAKRVVLLPPPPRK
jgi:hypothetical protein